MNDVSKLIKNLSIYTLGNSFVKIASFLLVPLYSIYLSPEDYGIISAMGLLSSFAFIIITLSLDRSIYRCYFDYNSIEDKKTFLGTITISLFVITSIFTILMIVFSNYLSLAFKSISFYPYYLIAIVTLFVSVYYQITLIFLRITEQSKKFVLYTTSFFIVQTALIIYFLVYLKGGAAGKLFAVLIANLCFSPLPIITIKNNAYFRFNAEMLRNALFYSLPIIPSLLSAFVLNLSDRIFIERYYTLSEVGIYSMGYKLAGFMAIISSSFFGAYNPMFYRIANFEKEKKSLLRTINNNYIIIIIILHFIAYIFSEDIFRLMINHKYYEAHKIFKLIVIGNVFNIAFSLVNMSFGQSKKMVTLMFIVIGGAIVNIGLNFALVPIYGMYGAAYATILSFIVIGFVKYAFARKYFFVPWQWKKILSYLFLIAVLLTVTGLLKGESTQINMLLKIIIAFALTLIYFLKNKRSIVKLLGQSKS